MLRDAMPVVLEASIADAMAGNLEAGRKSEFLCLSCGLDDEQLLFFCRASRRKLWRSCVGPRRRRCNREYLHSQEGSSSRVGTSSISPSGLRTTLACKTTRASPWRICDWPILIRCRQSSRTFRTKTTRNSMQRCDTDGHVKSWEPAWPLREHPFRVAAWRRRAAWLHTHSNSHEMNVVICLHSPPPQRPYLTPIRPPMHCHHTHAHPDFSRPNALV